MNNDLDERDALIITFASFGHKYGVPEDTYRNYNLTKLPIPKMHKLDKKLSGLSEEFQTNFYEMYRVSSFLEEAKEDVQMIIKELEESDERPSNIILGFGCHSGYHRSVAVVEYVAKQPFSLATSKWKFISTRIEHRHMVNYKKKGRAKEQEIRNNRDRKRRDCAYHDEY